MSDSEDASQVERRVITCLVLDVVGSTDLLSARLGPDRLKGELRRLFTTVREIVELSGGIVEKFLGDGLLAVYGIPQAHEDDAVRALRAALDCVRVVAPAGPPVGGLAVRLAIESGEALVDRRVRARDQEHGIVGLCVNWASRLQEKAGAGEILVGPACYELTKGVAEFEEVGPFPLKGLGEVTAWRLSRLMEAHASHRPGFVGRSHELEVLGQAYERARGGSPALVLIVGPPGQGKSRLVEEFIESVRLRSELLVARCRPDDERGSESPLRQLLSGGGPAPTTVELETRIKHRVSSSDERRRVSQALAHSAGLEVSPQLLSLRGATREGEFLHAWSLYLDALAQPRPLLVCVEDLQWADPTVTRLLVRLAERGSIQLLIVGTARPEILGSVPLRAGSSLIQLDLGPLDPDALAMLAKEVGAYDRESIERAEGNPLFLLELARSPDHSGPLPLTIQGAIGAHLDTLAPEDRSLVGFASVSGEQFEVREVAILADRPPSEVVGSLARLAHLRYIVAADGGYRFHHRLVRDVAYSRLTTEHRLRLHARFALEAAPEEAVETIAHHWWIAMGSADADWVWKDDPERNEYRRTAFQAQLLSARRHADLAASDRALQVVERAARLASGLEEGIETDALMAEIHALRGEGDEAWQAWSRVLAAYAKTHTDAPVKIYVRMVRQACWIWGTFRRLPKREEVVDLMTEGARVARSSGDSLALANLLVCRRGFVGSAVGLPEALESASTSGDLSGLGEVLVELATVESLEGDLKAALATCDRVDSLIQRGAGVDPQQMVHWRFMAHYHAGNLDAAESIAKEAQARMPGQTPHNQTHTLGMLAAISAARGRWTELRGQAAETEKLVSDNPSLGFCLVGAGAAAWGAVAEIREGEGLRAGLEPLVLRMVPESAAIRASVLFLPEAMVGNDRFLDEAKGAYQANTQFWDRQQWDHCGVNFLIGLTDIERWDEMIPYLEKLERVGSRGGRMCLALREAILEERARAGGGPEPRHEYLRSLGYTGLSDLVSFRHR